MKHPVTGALALLAILAALPLGGQERGRPERDEPRVHSRESSRPRANQGQVPPPPVARGDRSAAPRPEIDERNRINSTPHVSHNEWFGHDRPDDPRFHLEHPYSHGRFSRFGPQYRYSVVRIDPTLHRFWLPGGLLFEVAAFEWALAADWCWTCGDDFVIYDDPDHIGWYLLYDVHTGLFVHVEYLGS
jgi:hypothetical protein